ncbi:MAG: tRNA pseudouridine(38-40) synthase TruA [Actinobacteria bacterium]|nr:tRNA pseudouridine(38-40) synthase TruA [Actinomycetota bacterium]
MNEPLFAPAQEGLTRLRGTLAYDGKDFFGWGIQPDRRTVQATVEHAVATVLRIDPVTVQCAGRTDAGVHARGQVVHFDIPTSTLMEMNDLVYKFNSLLPEDVAFLELQTTTPDFDARFSALARNYSYLIYLYGRNPLLRNHAHRSWMPLDVAAMHEASQRLLGLHDFAAFCRKREGATTIRTLLRFDWTETSEGLIRADIKADAFCYSMVRGLVGAVLEVGEGKRPAEWVTEYLEGRARKPEIYAAPALGLTFESVEYPPADEFASRVQETLRVRDIDGTP